MRPNRPGAALLAGALAAGSAQAGRPLTVDDAGVNAKGEGHVEAWAGRSDGVRTLNLSPAYAFAEAIEAAALVSRDTTDRVTGTALQLKWLITPSRDSGCNLGVSFGASRARGGGVNEDAAFVNGLFSCNSTRLGNLHINLGAVKPSQAQSVRTWGLALEREIGAVTPHIEWFGNEGSRPTWQVGARGDVAKQLQLDGTIGRGNGFTQYSLGLKFRF